MRKEEWVRPLKLNLFTKQSPQILQIVQVKSWAGKVEEGQQGPLSVEIHS